jgi:hypothetical protein
MEAPRIQLDAQGTPFSLSSVPVHPWSPEGRIPYQAAFNWSADILPDLLSRVIS